jgi:hypothetical protein
MNKLASIAAPVACAIAVSLSPTSARAADFQTNVALGGGSSVWRGDPDGFGSLRLGLRFADIAGVYALGRVGYGAVDERMLTTVEIGGQLWLHAGPTRPYLRLGLVHAHEETMASVKQEPAGTLFGIGDGIRHRGGGEAALGLDYAFSKKKSFDWLVGGEVIADLFPDQKGPKLYVGGAATIGINYAL